MNIMDSAFLRRRMSIPIGFLILSVAACARATDAADPGLELRTDRVSYMWGDEGLLTLKNLDASAVSIVIVGSEESGICGLSALELRSESGWEPQDLGCVRTMVLRHRELGGGAAITQRFKIIDPGFQRGSEYRFAVAFQDPSGGGAVQYSNVFTIEE